MNDNQKFNKINAIISIVIAFIAWVYVVYNYSPMKNVTYTSIPVSYVGMDTLANRGYAIKSTTTDSVDVVLSIPRKDYGHISAEDIAVTADVSGAVEGINGVSLQANVPDGIKLKKLKTRSISVEVAECTTKDVDLTVIYDRSMGNGTEPVAKTLSYKRVSVVGIPENIEKVSYAIAPISSSDLGDNPMSFVLETVAVDEKGREVPHILVLPSEVSANVMIGEVKEVPLDIEITNVPNGVLYNVPGTVKIKGTADTLDRIDKIEAQTIDLSNIQENTTISINYILPEGVNISQASIAKKILINKEK